MLPDSRIDLSQGSVQCPCGSGSDSGCLVGDWAQEALVMRPGAAVPESIEVSYVRE